MQDIIESKTTLMNSRPSWGGDMNALQNIVWSNTTWRNSRTHWPPSGWRQVADLPVQKSVSSSPVRTGSFRRRAAQPGHWRKMSPSSCPREELCRGVGPAPRTSSLQHNRSPINNEGRGEEAEQERETDRRMSLSAAMTPNTIICSHCRQYEQDRNILF